MDNRIVKPFLVVLALIMFSLWFVSKKTEKVNPVDFDIDYNPKKIKQVESQVEKKQEKPISDEVVLKKETTQEVPTESVPSISNEMKENMAEPPRVLFCRTYLPNCSSCANPYDSSLIGCDYYLKQFEQKQVYEKLKSNPNFNEYLRTYHPDIPVDTFSLQDLKMMINHYSSLIQQTPEETFKYLGVESEDIIYCHTTEDNCL